MQILKVVAIVAGMISGPALAADFHLVCEGSATANDTVIIDIVAGAGRIRLPSNLWPTFHRGDSGWFTLSKIREDVDTVTAKASTSLISSPKVRINRLSGAISINGRMASFGGRCQPYDPATVKRAF